ncbi:MAG: hypothetical protein ACI3XV_01655, partial [Bacteroidaceae bacterium]
MKTFLSHVAQDLTARFGGNLHDVTIVFPGKRASLFLTQELTETGISPLWEPEYISMDSLFREFTALEQANPIESVCTLLRLMQEIIPEERDQSLDTLWGWGEVILSDFDDIDKHMADARLVLANAQMVVRKGGEVLTRTRATSARRENGLWIVEAEDIDTGKKYSWQARGLVNAT